MMFQVSQRMKLLKSKLKSLNKQEQYDIELNYFQNKLDWIKIGDDNTAYFYRALKVHKYRKRVIEIKDHDG
ncbi:Adenylosuccinate synthetase isozyme 2 B [Bienertia sinuspersici]